MAMNIVYIGLASLILNFLFFLFLLVFGKYSWFQLKSKFMKNPVQVNVINTSGRVISYLVSATNETVLLPDKKIRYCPKHIALFNKGIAQYYYFQDQAEPLQFTENDSINPEYWRDILMQAEINGSNGFLNKLIMLNWFILVLAILVIVVIVVATKEFDNSKKIDMIMQFIKSMNTTTITA